MSNTILFVEEILGDEGIQATTKQISSMAGSIDLYIQSDCSLDFAGDPPRPFRADSEIDSLKDQICRLKKITSCPICHGSGLINSGIGLSNCRSCSGLGVR